MPQDDQESPRPRALLIDLENCPQQIGALADTISDFTRVVTCHGGTEPKVPLKLVTVLAAAINEGKLEIVRMKSKGKNAADFGLTFWAGRLMAEMPPETEFVVLSQDADLDHAVQMLRAGGRDVIRVDGKNKVLAASGGGKMSVEKAPPLRAAVEDYGALLRNGKARPAKKATLRKSIKFHFKNRTDIDPDEVVQGLVARRLVSIDGSGRVTYADAPEEPEPAPLFDVDEEIPF